jgi:predicted small lipoprotein YifL
MSQDIAARLPLLGAFGLRRRVVGRCGRPACLALITALVPGAGLALAVAGCGGQGPVSLPHKSSGVAAPVALTAPPQTPQQQVVAAYNGYWQALGQALDTQNAAKAGLILESHTTSASISSLIRGFETDWARGEVQYGAPVPHILSVRITGNHAAVHDCADFSHAGVQNARTGQVVGSLGSSRVNMISTLVRTHGRWLVSNQVPVVSSCVP